MFILKFTKNNKQSMNRFDNNNHQDTIIKCHFFHGNGYPQNDYRSLIDELSFHLQLKSMRFKPFSKSSQSHETLNNWKIFKNDSIDYANQNNINQEYAIGHSMGGNILLQTALDNNNFYKGIVLLDPTIFIPITAFFWRLINILSVHPLIRSVKKRRTNFISLEEIFVSYRGKRIFSKINDKQLKEYIQSIFISDNGGFPLNYDLKWEESIYRTAGRSDIELWKKIDMLKIPTLIIVPDKKPVFSFIARKKISKNKFIRIKTINDSSHLFPLEYPLETSKIIIDFFKNI